MTSHPPNIVYLLRNNFGTYTADVANVAQCLEQEERDVQKYAAELIVLEAAIAELQKKHDLARCRVEQCRSLLAPIRRLPAEIIVRVFSFCCDRSEAAQNIDCPVVRLSQVCAGWRELTRTTSSLWASLSIDLYWWSAEVDRLKAMLDLHLELSHNAPLNIILDSSESDDSSVTVCVLKALCAHSARWLSLTIDMDAPQLLRDISFLSAGNSLPRLRRLELRLFQPGLGQESIEVFRSAPALDDLTIANCRFGRVMPPLPWRQLTRLTFQYCLTSIALRYLELASQARHVILVSCINDDFRHNPGSCPQISYLHNTLQSLSMIIDEVDPELWVLFNFLTLPSLNYLKISCAYAGPLASQAFSFTAEHDGIASFLARSQCHLTSLCLENLPLRDTEVIALLQLLPTLTNLAIHDRALEQPHSDDKIESPFTAHLFESLTVNNTTTSHTGLLPRLKELGLAYNTHSFPVSAFLRMIQSRWSPGAHSANIGIDGLTSLIVRPFETGDKKELDLQAIRGLAKEGLRVLVEEHFLAGKFGL
ncbi:hypothetical protein D9758_008083 [Tetrapyrgos nigripes]|uniref:F-box domain-containing protein n=1 Tax=Tetrapyrgos nigripes TaxID=182062 RepID=A0A8H5LPT3_9AGAR|nr:hypothetical protein D9758_008083 [Tetrapyrgos nigripes]